MVEAARLAKLLLDVAQVVRFERGTASLRERVGVGQVGSPIFARAEFFLMLLGITPAGG